MELSKYLTILFITVICSFLIFSLNMTNCWVVLAIVVWILSFNNFLKKLITLPSPKSGFGHICPSIMIILGSGGHTWEMLKIMSLLKKEYQYIPIYIVGKCDILSENHAKNFELNFNRRFFINSVTRPRGYKESILSPKVLLKSFVSFYQSIQLVLSHKPNCIIGNGPSISVPILLAGWLLNSVGTIKTKLIYVESMARIESLSISAKILRPFVSDIFCVWLEMCLSFKFRQVASISLIKNELEFVENQNITAIDNATKTVFITVGTTEFDDLISLVFSQDFHFHLISQGFSNVIVQIGSRSKYRCDSVDRKNLSQLKFEIFSVVSEELFMTLLKRSDLVISHGGAGTLIQALELRKTVIAVINPKTAGNHQGELVNYLVEIGCIYTCNVEGITNCLRRGFTTQSPLKYFLKFNDLSAEFTSAISQNYVVGRASTVTTKTKKFSIVIPSTMKDQFQVNTLLKSLREYLDPKSVDQIHMIVPKCDFPTFSLLVAELNWKSVQVIVTPESDLVSENILALCDNQFKSRSGWFKQQILKLKSADIVKTDYYLILDSDCILRRPLNYFDLIESNGADQCRSYLQIEEMFKHPRWFRGSAKLLGITSSFMENLKGMGIGVTPQILSVHVVKQLTEFLEQVHEVPWPILLANNRFQVYPPAIWTEYTLYFLFAARSGLLEKHHILGRNNIANYYQSAWTRDQASNWSTIDNSLNSAPFLIFQSNLGLGGEIPFTFVKDLISKRDSITVSEIRRKKIYIISSELEFYPVIGGINTFIRVIISSFKELTVLQNQNVDLVFCGLKCGDENVLKSCPSIPGISFKFFTTPCSSKSMDLSTYFNSFTKFSANWFDLQQFGYQCTKWILSDSQPGDICVTTIVYEFNVDIINKLRTGGLKIVHTVHSLVARKAMANLRFAPSGKFNFFDKIRINCLRNLLLNEKMLLTLCNSNCLSWTIPKIVTENLIVEKTLIEASRAIFVPSRQLTELASSLYFKAKDRIHYVPWGLPEGTVLGEYVDMNYHKGESMIDKINCLALCKLIPQKGVDVLIDALKKIEDIAFNLSRKINLKICGDMSYMGQVEYFKHLKQQCACLKTIKVEFTGWLEGQAKWDVMSHSDLLLVPSYTEPFGFCLIEAMKVGMGVVSFETEGPLDIVEPSFGRLVPMNMDNEVMATNFALAVIDLCYSRGASDGFREIKEKARKAAEKWNMKTFFETLFSII